MTNIEKALKDIGMSRRQLARLTGMSEVTVGRYVNGRRKPSAYVLWRISQVLKVPMEDLLGHDEE